MLVWECSKISLKYSEFLIFLVQIALRLEIDRFITRYFIHSLRLTGRVDIAVNSFFFVFCLEKVFGGLEAKNEVQYFSVQ